MLDRISPQKKYMAYPPSNFLLTLVEVSELGSSHQVSIAWSTAAFLTSSADLRAHLKFQTMDRFVEQVLFNAFTT